MDRYKITGIYKLRKSKNKYRLYVKPLINHCSTEEISEIMSESVDTDDEYFDVSESFVNKYDLSKGRQLNRVEYEKILKEMAYQQALYFIAYQDRTEMEVRRKLVKNNHPAELIDEIIDILTRDNYINDRRYAKLFMEQKIKKQGYKKISYYLKNKGISSALIQEVCQDISEDVDVSEEQFLGAVKLANKKLAELEYSNIDKYKKKQRVYSLLVRKGYHYDVISKVMDEMVF